MSFRRIATIRRLINLIPKEKRNFAAWWYGRLIPNDRERSQPKIEVLFREVDSEGKALGKTKIYPVNIALLGQVPLGSIWRAKRNVGNIKLTRRAFKVNFSPQGWDTLQSLHKTESDRYLIPPFSHPLLRGVNAPLMDSWTIRFKLATGGFLIIPAIEYFVRAYGLSGEIHRILLTYSWNEALKRLFGDHQPPVAKKENGRWIVHPGPYMQQNDTPFLAHLLHDQNTRRLTKKLHAQAETAHNGKYHLRVEPWHRNIGLIEVLGKPLPDNGFLGLRISGIELPKHPPIDVIRIHKEQPDEITNGDKTGGNTVMLQTIASSPDMKMADDQPPDHGLGHFELTTPAFKWLGEPGEIRNVVREDGKIGRPSTLKSNIVDTVSAGDPAGSPKGIRKVVSHTPLLLESMGTLKDMWDAFHHLQKLHPETILDVGYVTWGKEVRCGTEPELCPLPRPVANRKNKKGFWYFIDKNTPRGLLLIWVRTADCEAVIVEIQRRTDPANPEKEKESFKGLAIRVNGDLGKVLDWLERLAANIVESKGVYTKAMLSSCPTLARTFKHAKSQGDTKAGEHTAWRALAKVGCMENRK